MLGFLDRFKKKNQSSHVISDDKIQDVMEDVDDIDDIMSSIVSEHGARISSDRTKGQVDEKLADTYKKSFSFQAEKAESTIDLMKSEINSDMFKKKLGKKYIDICGYLALKSLKLGGNNKDMDYLLNHFREVCKQNGLADVIDEDFVLPYLIEKESMGILDKMEKRQLDGIRLRYSGDSLFMLGQISLGMNVYGIFKLSDKSTGRDISELFPTSFDMFMVDSYKTGRSK